MDSYVTEKRDPNDQKKTSLAYKIVKWGLRVCCGKVTVSGAENLPEEPCIIAGNHCQLNGPISCELFFPGTPGAPEKCIT